QRAERYGTADREAGTVVDAVQGDVCEGLGIFQIPDHAEQRECGIAAARQLVLNRKATLPLDDVLARHPCEVDGGRGVGIPRRFRRGERGGVGSVQILITPPVALPNNAEDEPRSTSIRSVSPSSRFVSCPVPSGSVCGIPSTSTLMPRTANCARAPKPRIEMR